MRVSGAKTNIGFNSSMCFSIPLVDVSILIVHEDIFGMALGEPIPFLVCNVEVPRIETARYLAAVLSASS